MAAGFILGFGSGFAVLTVLMSRRSVRAAVVGELGIFGRVLYLVCLLLVIPNGAVLAGMIGSLVGGYVLGAFGARGY